jgi:hypothetical protein
VIVKSKLGSAFLAALVIGSGIAAQTLSPSDVGLQLFENAAATAMGLATIILMFGPVSGGHFNPSPAAPGTSCRSDEQIAPGTPERRARARLACVRPRAVAHSPGLTLGLAYLSPAVFVFALRPAGRRANR